MRPPSRHLPPPLIPRHPAQRRAEQQRPCSPSLTWRRAHTWRARRLPRCLPPPRHVPSRTRLQEAAGAGGRTLASEHGDPTMGTRIPCPAPHSLPARATWNTQQPPARATSNTQQPPSNPPTKPPTRPFPHPLILPTTHPPTPPPTRRAVPSSPVPSRGGVAAGRRVPAAAALGALERFKQFPLLEALAALPAGIGDRRTGWVGSCCFTAQ